VRSSRVLRDSLWSVGYWALSQHVELKKKMNFVDLTVFPLDAARTARPVLRAYVAFSNALAREVMQTVQIPWPIILCNCRFYTRGISVEAIV
jgi:hypothetical protein